MGTFTHSITLSSPSGDRTETLTALVDTGATFTSAPTTTLERLGVKPQWEIRLGLADGPVVERPVGEVVAEMDGVRRTIICIFNPTDAPSLIGAHTLEAFLLMVDPAEQKLLPKDALWLGCLHCA